MRSKPFESARSVFSHSDPIIDIPVEFFPFDMAKTKVFFF